LVALSSDGIIYSIIYDNLKLGFISLIGIIILILGEIKRKNDNDIYFNSGT
jgi:hypothetical protein